MKVKITKSFWDLQNPAEEPVAIDTVLTVSAERGKELIDLEFAVAAPATSKDGDTAVAPK